MRPFTIFGLLLVLTGLSLGYQNCGSGFESSVESSEPLNQSLPSESLDIPDQALQPGGSFVAGDSFNYDLVPYKSALVSALIVNYDYANYADHKAVAIASNGLGYVAYGRNIALDEVSRQALESCNMISGQACVIIAKDNTFVTNSNTLDSEMTYTLPSAGQSFDPSQFPVVGPSRNNQSLQTYLSSTVSTKAIAFSPSGFYTYYYPNDSLAYSQEEVNRRVLQQCELTSVITPCAIYAEGNKVVFSPSSWSRMSSIDFSITSVTAVPPYAVAHTQLNALNEKYIPELGAKKGAIYLSRNGRIGFATNAIADTAKSEAKAACEALSGVNTCYLYAIDDKITFKPTQLQANYSHKAIYCKFPRASCAQHKLVGCDQSGDYWILDSGNSPIQITCDMTGLIP